MQARIVRKTVRQRGIGPCQAILRIQARIHRTELLKFLPAITNIFGRVSAEEVVIAYGDKQRFGRERIEQVPAIEAQRTGAREVLLGIVSGSGRIEIGAGYVFGVTATDGGRGAAIIARWG